MKDWYFLIVELRKTRLTFVTNLTDQLVFGHEYNINLPVTVLLVDITRIRSAKKEMKRKLYFINNEKIPTNII